MGTRAGGARWGKKGWKFATEDGCEYPKELCNEVARAIAAETSAQSQQPPARRKQRSKHSFAAAAEPTTLGKQSRRHPRPEAVPRDSQPNITLNNHIGTKKWGAKVGKSKNRQRLPVPLCHLAPRS